LRVATPAARLGITPAKLGLVYSLHDTKLLVDLVGPAQAKRILFTGALVEAAEAERIGLIDVLADDAAVVVDGLAAAIADASPHSIAATKRIVRRILDGQTEDDADTLAQFDAAFTGEDFEERVSAFLAKRKPRFRQR
jgi:enoyl-CoA hydratase/carnithine racemase